MIRLSRNKRYKLFEIVRLRDRDLWDVYERILGVPYPAGKTSQRTFSHWIQRPTSTYSITDSGVWIKNGRESQRSISKARK